MPVKPPDSDPNGFDLATALLLALVAAMVFLFLLADKFHP